MTLWAFLLEVIDSLLLLVDSWLILGADAAAADSFEAPPAGQLLPDELGVVPAGLVVSRVSAVGSESGRRFTQTRWVFVYLHVCFIASLFLWCFMSNSLKIYVFWFMNST